MNTQLLYRIMFALLSLLMIGCNDDKEVFFESLTGDEALDRVHPNERDKPYPREEHELYLNPAPLIVPKTTRGANEFLEFELSQDINFPEQGTYRSGKLAWNMYNIHEEMVAGTWFWRFRKVDKSDRAGLWSEVNKFTVTGKEDVFVTPKWTVFQQNIPTTFPRINCFMTKDIQQVTPINSSHIEYANMMNRANGKMNSIILPAANPYDYDMEELGNDVDWILNTAYQLTGEQKYFDKIMGLGRQLIDYEATDNQLFLSNFHSAGIINVLSIFYEIGQGQLTEEEKTRTEQLMVRMLNHYRKSYVGSIENHVFENHTWQIVLRAMVQGAFTICHEYPEAMTFLEYSYELWTARAPASGFNRDGAWINGAGYFGTNQYTLFYMPMLLSHVTGFNFLDHPWYKAAGKAMVYSQLPNTGMTSFGDGVESTEAPSRGRLAFADFIAREIQDPYAAWYVTECGKSTGRETVHADYSMRLYRVARGYIQYGGVELTDDDFENYIWNKDIGEGIAFSNMRESGSNLSLAFRSSPFGSGSHTLADQNSFKLLYKGVSVYMNAGYYQNFSDKHNLLQYRHTRGHNTMLVNGIGQPFTTRAYGNINRGLNSDNLAYFMGDASHAYCGISEYPMWISAFESAGIAQVPRYGFGETPLNNYKRHIFMLRPNKVVIYDDLGANEASTWQWLLHSPVEFRVAGNKITTNHTDKGGFTSVAQIFSGQTPTIETTNRWFTGGEPADQNPTKYPTQWHLTANFGPSINNKILTIIQVSDDGRVEDIWQVNNHFIMGDWEIEAELNGDRPAAISIANKVTGTAFSYGVQAPTVNGAPYQRQQENSSVLYDNIYGTMQVQETVDKPLQTTRAAR